MIFILILVISYTTITKAPKVFSVEHAGQADKKIFFVSYASQTDVIICFADFISMTGCKKKENIHFVINNKLKL